MFRGESGDAAAASAVSRYTSPAGASSVRGCASHAANPYTLHDQPLVSEVSG